MVYYLSVFNMVTDGTEIDMAETSECDKDLQNNLSLDLHIFKDYLNCIRFNLNIPKMWVYTVIDTFQSLAKMPDIHVHFDNEPFNQVTVAKYLGMFVDSNLKWDDHINKLLPKHSAKIRFLWKII